MRIVTARQWQFLSFLLVLLVALAFPTLAQAAPTPQPCPNLAVRARQPHAVNLPDCRAYVQVTPVEAGADALGFPGNVTASPDGDRVRYYSISPFEGTPSPRGALSFFYISSHQPCEGVVLCDGSEEGGKKGPGEWATQGVLPFNALKAVAYGFSEDLSQSIVNTEESRLIEEAPGLGRAFEEAPGAVGRSYYLRETTTGTYRLLAHLPAGGEITPAAFSGDGRQMIFESREQLLAGARAGAINVYEIDTTKPPGEQLSLVGVLANAECEALSQPVGCAPPAGSIAGAGAGANSVEEPHYTQSAISRNGSRMFFTAEPSGRIYARLEGTETIAVSPGPAEFLQATAEGSYVLYSEAGGLWRFDTETKQRAGLAVPATGTGTLTLFAGGTGNLSFAYGAVTLTKGSKEVTELETKRGEFAKGQEITGAGIPAGTTIEAVGPGTLTLSAAASASGADEGLFAGSKEVTDLTTTTGGFAKGQEIAGEGIPAGTTIEAVGAGTLKLSQLPTEAGSAVALSVGSREVSDLTTTTGAFAVAQPIEGAGIPPETTITALTAHTLTLSEPVTAAGTAVALTAAPPDVIGALGVSEDGSTAYFAAAGVLAANKREYEYENTKKELAKGVEEAETRPAIANLYEWHQNGEEAPTTSFIAQLSSKTEGLGDEADWRDKLLSSGSLLTQRSSRLTPDGQTLLFSSLRPLDGYDNGANRELFRYSAPHAPAPASLICVSCGAPGSQAPYQAWLAGDGEDIRPTNEAALTRNLSANGQRIFFETDNPLIPSEDSGGVYEWEAKGEGTCDSETQNGGCLSLIAGGSSYLADASTNGEHVFFFTREPLAETDTEEKNINLVDAQENGAIEKPKPKCEPTVERCPPPECYSPEECKPTKTEPPLESFPATAAFNGPGNLVQSVTTIEKPKPKPKTAAQLRAEKLAKALKSCKTDHSKAKRKRCEATARTHYAAVRSKKQSTQSNRRSKR